MARLKSVIAEGFYPTPESVLPRIANLIAPAAMPVPSLDPCAGEGRAMQYLAAQWNLMPYLVEINTQRGAECRKVTPNTLVMDVASVNAANMALVYDNPPYQDREKGVRDEVYFIQRMDEALTPGGVHIVVIPDYRLAQTRKIARFFASRYDRIRIWRFPDPEYQTFHQIVLVGVKRKRAIQDRLAADYLVSMAQGNLPVLPEAPLDDPYRLPAPDAPVVFEGHAIDYAQAVAEAHETSWPCLPVACNSHLIGLLKNDGKEAAVDAYAHHRGQIVLLSLSGYKTHLKAIKAQLDQREAPLQWLGAAIGETPGVRYIMHTRPLSKGEHWVIVHPRATVEGAENGLPFYCIGGQEPPLTTFVEQLRRAVPIPIFSQWAEALWNLGVEHGLIARLGRTDQCKREGCQLWQVEADADRWRAALSAALAARQLPTEGMSDESDFSPAMPFKRGHLLFLLITNILPSVILKGAGKTLIVRGRTVAGVRTEGDCQPGGIVEETTDRRGEIIVADADTGEVTILTDNKAQIEFVQAWGEQLAQAVLDRFQPLYRFDYRSTLPDRALTLLDLLASNCAPLPGCARPGLLESQKHIAAALWRVINKYGFAILNGEQGSGKTKVSIAAAALAEVGRRTGFPMIVSCPEIVTEKWVDELRETWPLIEARIVTTPAEMDEFFRQAELNPGRKWTMVIPNSRLGQGDGWRPVYARETLLEDSHGKTWVLARYRTDGSALWEQQGQHVVVRRPDGSAIKQLARSAPLAGKPYDIFKCPTCGDMITYQDKNRNPVIVTDAGWFERAPQHCSHCGGALYQDDRLLSGSARKKQNSMGLDTLEQVVAEMRPRVSVTRASRVQDARGQWHVIHHCPACGQVVVDLVGRDAELPIEIQTCACGQSLWTPSDEPRPWYGRSIPKPVRYSLVDYYRRRHCGKARLYIADEVHLLKGGDTNRGDAFGKLARAVPNVLVMTATLFNGKSSSVFYILYRLWDRIRREFRFTDKMAWIGRHGVLRRVFRYEDGSEFEDSSAQTGLRRRQIGVSELPGLGPELVALLLECSVFIQLKDIGIQLPPYQELPLDVTLDKDHAKAYERFHEEALAELKEDWRLAGAFVQSLLSYSVAPWRITPLCDPDGNEKASGPDMEIVCRHCGRPLGEHKHCLGPRPREEAMPESQQHGRWKGLRPIAGEGAVTAQPKPKPRKGYCHYHGDPLPAECQDGCGVKRERLFAAEKRLVEVIQLHRQRGERVLVFVAHTHRWNVIPRLQHVFDTANLRATSMPKMQAAKRREWIAAFDMSGTDVLIASVNELAEGVDLLAFSVIVFWEISYVVSKVSQAARRSLRVTQTRPITVYFVNPIGTLASQALEVVLYEMMLDGILRGELPATEVMNRVANEHATFVEKVARAAIEAAGDVQDLAAVFARHNQAMQAVPVPADAYLCAPGEAPPGESPVQALVPLPAGLLRRIASEPAPLMVGEQTRLL